LLVAVCVRDEYMDEKDALNRGSSVKVFNVLVPFFLLERRSFRDREYMITFLKI
jgi:hypothetical protein